MGFNARRIRLLVIACVIGLTAAASAVAGLSSSPSEAQTRRLGGVGMPFVANGGQTDASVSFFARTFAGTAFVTTEGKLVYSLNPPRKAGAASEKQGWALTETFSRESMRPVGIDRVPVGVADFTASGRGVTAAFERVRLGVVAPGIDVTFRATGDNVEKIFSVQPGADPASIRIRIDGGTSLRIGAEGELAVTTGLGDVAFTAPIAYQDGIGGRVPVAARYRLDARASSYGFDIGEYDRTRPLIIDPIVRSTYSGGGATDVVKALLLHPGSGDVYVTGATTSANFPGVVGGPTNAGNSDAFIARYSDSLTQLKNLAFYGGLGDESGNAIAILQSTGHIYVAGSTTSSSGLTNITGSYVANGDAMLLRFDGNLTTVLSAIYFGGNGADTATALAVDAVAAEVVMVGETTSTNLPVGLGGGAQPGAISGVDGFVARFSSTLSPIRTTYFGGSGDDRIKAVAIEPVGGDVLIAGTTTSTNLLKTANGALPTPGTDVDGFVARLDRSLVTLFQTSYFGGSGADEITAVAVHPFSADVYVAGTTTSADLRGRRVGQTTKSVGATFEGFVARFYPELTGLKAVTYFGDVGDDKVSAIAISRSTGEIYIAGQTTSATLSGLTSGSAQSINGGGNDAFVARISAGLDSVLQSTFVGAGGDDFAYALGVNSVGVYVAGQTASGNFPGALGLSAQPTQGGGANDGFVSRIDTDLRLAFSNPAQFTVAPAINVLPLSVQTSAPTPVLPTGAATVYVDGQAGSSWCASSGPACTCDLSGSAFRSDVSQIDSPQPYYVCVRQVAPAALNVISEVTLHIGAVAGTYRVTTGTIPGFGCTLDVDGSGFLDALGDGLIILRALLGMTGSAVTTNTVGQAATRTSWDDIRAYLNTTCGASFLP